MEQNKIPNKKIVVEFNNESINNAVNEWIQNAEKAKAKYGHISNWNTSQVTTMKRLFFKATLFNEPIFDWDVSNVTDMSYMFSNANTFNQSIGNWDVSRVTTMKYMFSNANAFNQPIKNGM